MSRRKAVLFFFAVAVVSTIPFLQTTGFGYVNLDDYDYRYIPQIESGLSLQTIVWGLTYLAHGIWMPMTWCSYALDVSLFGGTPGGMHIHNVIIHGLNCGLLFLFLSSLLSQKGWLRNYLPALLVALFWGLHPLRVEPVAWIASRKDVLSLFFELLALLLWVKHLKAGECKYRKLYWYSFLFFVLATMAKPSAMTFPVIALLLDVFVVRTDSGDEKWKWKQYVSLFIYAAVIAVLAQHAQTVGGAVDVVGAPLWWRVLNAVASYGIYLFHTVWPSDLAAQCVCRCPEMPKMLWTGVLCVVTVGTVIVCRLAWQWKRIREFRRVDDWVLAGLLIFTLAVGPFLGIASFGYHAYADRFTYVPSLGLSVLLFGLATNLSKIGQSVICCFVPIALAIFTWLSWHQCGIWKNDETLYRRTIAVDGDRSAIARRSLASYYFEIEHNPEKVITEYERAREIGELTAMDIACEYIICIFEKGQLDKGEEEVLRYQNKLFKQLEQDRIRSNGEKQSISVNFLVAVAAQAIARGEYDFAGEKLAEMRKAIPCYNIADYLEGVMCLKRGNAENALAAFRKIRPDANDSYLRFRWLTEKLPADDAEALKILPSLAWKEPVPPAK